MNNRKEYIDEVAEKMKKWDDEIVAMESKSDTASEQLQAEAKKRIQDLRIKKAELQGKLDKLKSSGEDAWEVLNTEFKESYENMKKAFDEAKTKLNM